MPNYKSNTKQNWILNTPFFIARKMGRFNVKLTGIVKKIAIFSIAAGLAVMIISVCVVIGFQNEIKNKVIGFGSHIQITAFDNNVSFETQSIDKDQDFINEIMSYEGIKHVQTFATKPGIIKTDKEIHGVVFKGIGSDFSWDFFGERLIEGSSINISDTARNNGVIISGYVANLLNLHIDDDIFVYFIQDPPRVRRLKVKGIYETGLQELDEVFILGDISHIQRLNDWNNNQVAGFEVMLSDFSQLYKMNMKLLDVIPYDFQTRTINELYPQIFDWLALLDMNVYVIIFIMILVAGINMITTLLISVLEKTNMIGILKALGANNTFIRKVFLYNASFLITRGLFWGNMAGIGIALLQEYTGLIKLDQASYFVDVVPIEFNLLYILLLNAGTLILCISMLVIPSYIISKISPVKAITFR